MTTQLGGWLSDQFGCIHNSLSVFGKPRLLPPNHERGGYCVDFDGGETIGQFIVWPSLEVEIHVVDVESEVALVWQSFKEADLADLLPLLDSFLAAVLANERGS